MRYRSRCSKTKVGAVIVSAENRIAATGYNGPPASWRGDQVHLLPGQADNCANWCPYRRENPEFRGDVYDLCPSSHAEINALMHSSRADREGGAIYVTSSPCMTCAKAIANSGITTVVVVNQNPTEVYRKPESVANFLSHCQLKIVNVEVDPDVDE
jgi:dCMP deaminase